MIEKIEINDMYVDLKSLKKHLNVDEEFIDDDSLISEYEAAAEATLEQHIDHKLDEIAGKNGGNLPSPLAQAIKFLTGNFYANRENVAFAQSYELPKSYQYLTDLFHNYSTSGNTTL